MKFVAVLSLVVLLSGCGSPSAPASANGAGGKDSIVAMAKQGASSSEMLSAIDKTPGSFSLTENDVIDMHKTGVPDDVVIAMLRHNRN